MKVAVSPEALFKEAQARSLGIERSRNPEAALERLRAECLAYFDSLPEPPLYPRMNDPAREAAARLMPRSTELLASCLAVSKDAHVCQEAPTPPPLAVRWGAASGPRRKRGGGRRSSSPASSRRIGCGFARTNRRSPFS